MNYFILYFLIFVIWVNVYYLYKYSSNKDDCAPIDDIGVFWITILALYSTLPVFSWILQGYTYTSILRPRLLEIQPDISDINYLLLIAASYAISFTVVFKFFRKKIKKLEVNTIKKIPQPILVSSFVIVIITNLFLLFSGQLFGVQTADTYVDQYRVIQQAPLLVRQLLKYLLSFQSISMIIILTSFIQNWKKYKIYFYFFVLFTLINFNIEGGRASLGIIILSIFFLWHVTMKKISSKIWIACSTIGLSIFLILGVLRGVQNLSNYDLAGDSSPGVGEFDAIWGNALHLNEQKQAGNLSVPFTVKFEEFWDFIPSQLLFFNKRSLSVWYLDTYYPKYKEQGGGWAFGILSQAIIGFGPFEAFIRGGVLALLYGCLMSWYRKSKNNWWAIPFYLNIYLYSFMSIRDTTFTQLSTVITSLLPALLLIYTIRYILISNKS